MTDTHTVQKRKLKDTVDRGPLKFVITTTDTLAILMGIRYSVLGQRLSLRGIPVFPRELARLSHPDAGLAGTTSDIVVRTNILGTDIFDTEKHGLKQGLH